MPLVINLGLKVQANKLDLGSFDPKLYRLVKGNAKTENYSILTRVLVNEFKLTVVYVHAQTLCRAVHERGFAAGEKLWKIRD